MNSRTVVLLTSAVVAVAVLVIAGLLIHDAFSALSSALSPALSGQPGELTQK